MWPRGRRKRAPKSCARRLSCALDTSDAEISRFLSGKAPKPITQPSIASRHVLTSLITASQRCGLWAWVLCLRARIRSASAEVSQLCGSPRARWTDRSYLTPEQQLGMRIAGQIFGSIAEIRRAGRWSSPVGDFHVSRGSRFAPGGMRPSCWPPSPVGSLEPTSPRCRCLLVRHFFIPPQDGERPLLGVASGWLGVPSAAGVQLRPRSAAWNMARHGRRSPTGRQDRSPPPLQQHTRMAVRVCGLCTMLCGLLRTTIFSLAHMCFYL